MSRDSKKYLYKNKPNPKIKMARAAIINFR